MGLKGCKWSSLNTPGTKTPLSHPFMKLGESPFLTISPLGYNKNWPASMKVRKMKNYQNKMGLKCCKWSSLNTLGTEKSCFYSLLENDLIYLFSTPLSPFFLAFDFVKRRVAAPIAGRSL